jgi:hypothetical protein
MSVGIFDTAVLNRVVETYVQPIDFFLSNFFGGTQVSDVEEIYFDVVTDTHRRITPVVSPLVQGKVVEGMGYSTKSFAPAYLKDKRVFTPNKFFNRIAGEKIGGSLTPQQRLQASVAWHLNDQMRMLNRRLEVWAAETIRRGKCKIEGEGYPAVDVDFLRDASQTITLAGGNVWGTAGVITNGVSPLANIEAWSELIFSNSQVVAKTVIMDLAAWKLLRQDPAFTLLLSNQRRQMGEANIQTGPMLLGTDRTRYMGHAGDFDFWVYSGRYIDPITGTDTPMLPANTVILCSPADTEGVQHYGAIKDLKAGLQPRQLFVKSWEEEDPSARYFLMQSAPLLVPYRPNATLCATVA